jgi:phosphorylase kinase alpha/beta subunit
MSVAAPRLDVARRALLDRYRAQAEAIILARQDPISGLLPASTAVTIHGDYTDAWVRDNVYSILAIWGLAMAYRAEDPAMSAQLGRPVVRLMRGLLAAMMGQAAKVERFKHTQDPLDALHAKYDTRTGQPVVGDGDWGHLQIDATSLFLLMLAQMTAAGLQIVEHADEVDFVQNLVYYLGCAYRTPDYGIWERGNKRNDGMAEVNASSVGMAKAALQAIHGVAFLPGAAPAIHVPADDIANARTTLMNLLPRESQSKETDAALLSIIGFPAFAVDNPVLADRTRAEIVDKLEGQYGCKRFLRDGHQTVVEDHSRLHYEPGELARFEHIESEWPLFFCYQLLDAVLRGDDASAQDYRNRLEGLLQERDGLMLLPELYLVPSYFVDAERANPGSQSRVPNDNVPLVWAQSLYLLGLLVHDGLLAAGDLDPLGRRPQAGPPREVVVQLVVLASDVVVAARLSALGIATQTREQMLPVQVRHPDDLEAAYAELGRNPRLGLSGRPARRPGSLATSQIYQLGGQDLLFLPHFAHNQDSYLHLDNRLLIERVRTEIAYLQRRWHRPGQPLLVLRVTDAMLGSSGADDLLNDLRLLHSGAVEGVVGGHLQDLFDGAHRERIDWLDDLPARPAALATAPQDHTLLPWEEGATRPLSPSRAGTLGRESDPEVLKATLTRSRNPYEQIEIIGLLWVRLGPDAMTPLGSTVGQLAAHLSVRARWQRRWSLVRRTAGLLGTCDPGLEDAIAEIVLRQKRVAVGRAFNEQSIIGRPVGNEEIVARMHATGIDDPRYMAMVQELLMSLGMLIKANRALFGGTLTLRAWHLLRLVTGWLAREHEITQDEAFDYLLELSPHTIMERLREVIAREREMTTNLTLVQSLSFVRASGGLVQVRFPPESDPQLPADAGGWQAWREVSGVITRLPQDFYSRVWELLRHCRGVVIGDQLDSRNRLESALSQADMTRGERSFELQVEDLLHRITAPEYRQLNIEALLALSHLFRANWGLHLANFLVLDVVIGHAVRVSWRESHPEISDDNYNEHVGHAWEAFYCSPPHQVANWMLAALTWLLGAAPGTEATRRMAASAPKP